MNAVWRGRFTPAADANAVFPTDLLAPVPDFHLRYSLERITVPSIQWLGASPTIKCIVHRVYSAQAARRWVSRLGIPYVSARACAELSRKFSLRTYDYYVHTMARCNSHPERVHCALIILNANRPQMGLEVGDVCAGVSARSLICSPSRTPGNRNPDPFASGHCIISAAGRYPTMATC